MSLEVVEGKVSRKEIDGETHHASSRSVSLIEGDDTTSSGCHLNNDIDLVNATRAKN